MRTSVNDTELYFDVEGPELALDGPQMRARPTLVVLDGGPGFDQGYLRPGLRALADAQLVFVDLRGQGRSAPAPARVVHARADGRRRRRALPPARPRPAGRLRALGRRLRGSAPRAPPPGTGGRADPLPQRADADPAARRLPAARPRGARGRGGGQRRRAAVRRRLSRPPRRRRSGAWSPRTTPRSGTPTSPAGCWR
jgi:hypothetical protein